MAEEEKAEAAEEESAPASADTADAAAEAPADEAAESAPAEKTPAEEQPTFTAREIEKMNVPKLKEAALSYGGKISGVHGMDKAHLIAALKEINGIPLVEARRASKIDRGAVKQQIRNLKLERDQYIETKDRVQLGRVRKQIKALRRKLVRTA